MSINICCKYLDRKAIKVGFGKFQDNRFEIGLQQYNSKETSGNATQTLFNSSNMVAVSIDYIVTIPIINPSVVPFIKIGANLSRAELGFDVTSKGSGEKKDTLYGLGGTAGVGMAFQISKNLEILAGYDFTYREWEDMKNGPFTLKTKDEVQKLYAGFNLRF